MKKITLSIIFLFLFNANSLGHLQHYSSINLLEYELYRNNDLIGSHKYLFSNKDQKLIVDSEVSFKISKLGINLYKYYAKSEEIYENNKFKLFKSKTLQNKKEKYVNISVDESLNKLKIDGSSFKDTDINIWLEHGGIMKSLNKAQLVLFGRIIHQKVEFLGKKLACMEKTMSSAL